MGRPAAILLVQKVAFDVEDSEPRHRASLARFNYVNPCNAGQYRGYTGFVPKRRPDYGLVPDVGLDRNEVILQDPLEVAQQP